ncbi:hypothetical protein EYF80_066654 [Liparis tanakae]|uniref:Uncharacterized protein n=1 Tax=Liparis tanakae TaxID=230148 RepID=A0A4Z2E397_9TELE|nr:hypothetical protein EYF80_066654 [Liparis tanakae]
MTPEPLGKGPECRSRTRELTPAEMWCLAGLVVRGAAGPRGALRALLKRREAAGRDMATGGRSTDRVCREGLRRGSTERVYGEGLRSRSTDRVYGAVTEAHAQRGGHDQSSKTGASTRDTGVPDVTWSSRYEARGPERGVRARARYSLVHAEHKRAGSRDPFTLFALVYVHVGFGTSFKLSYTSTVLVRI